MITSVSLAGYCVDTSKFYDFMFINVCQGCFCFPSDFLFFSFVGLSFAKFFMFKLRLYMYHTFSEPQYGGPCTQGKSLTRTFTSAGDRSNTRLNRCLYIYKAFWTKKKKRDQVNALSNFSSDLKKTHAHVQVPIYLQIKCRCN